MKKLNIIITATLLFTTTVFASVTPVSTPEQKSESIKNYSEEALKEQKIEEARAKAILEPTTENLTIYIKLLKTE